MSNVLGDNLELNIFGESHSPVIGATLFGVPTGIKVDDEVIKLALAKRRPILGVDTSRVENDNYRFISGVTNGFTNGEPLTIEIDNSNVKSKDYESIKDTPRPGHADYVAFVKYGDKHDYRGGGRFSGRLTTPVVAIAAIIIEALKQKGIYIATHILRCGDVIDSNISSLEDVHVINNKNTMVIKPIEEDILNEINKVKVDGDSLGGITETAIYGLSCGMGDSSLSSVEGLISKAIFGVGAIKGIEFGAGFDFANMRGSQANDEFKYVDGRVVTTTNNNGGINGGIANGMPVTFRCVVKPTPSISKEQNTINLVTKENVKITVNGRHDPAIVRRIPIVINSYTALAVLDLAISYYGKDLFR